MNFWIVNPYGTLPGEGWRDYRSLMLAQAIAARGHRARWFLSNFVHRSKVYRSSSVQDHILQGFDGRLMATTLPARPYARNISLQRIRYEQSFGESFAQFTKQADPPDAIVLADPSLFYSAPVVAYCRREGVPLVLDVIDLWPELFAVVLPKPLRAMHRLVFFPLYRRRERLVQACEAVVAVTGDYLDTVYPSSLVTSKRRLVAYWGVNLTDFEQERARPAGDELLLGFTGDHRLLVAYAGTLGDAYDMNILAEAITRVAEQKLPIGFVVAGDGPRRADFEALARRLPDALRFLGPVDARDLASIYSKCHVGLMSYVRGSTVSMPIKFYDYLAGGLAIVNSLGREAGGFVESASVGLNYEPENLESLMGALHQLVHNPLLLQTSRSNALALAQDFDSQRQHMRFASLLEDLVQSRPH